MKPRYSAVLASMIWYLLVPPAGRDERSPLRDWQMVNVVETEKDCEAGRQKYYNDGIELLKIGKSSSAIAEGRRFTSATCVKADDPRLWKK